MEALEQERAVPRGSGCPLPGRCPALLPVFARCSSRPPFCCWCWWGDGGCCSRLVQPSSEPSRFSFPPAEKLPWWCAGRGAPTPAEGTGGVHEQPAHPGPQRAPRRRRAA